MFDSLDQVPGKLGFIDAQGNTRQPLPAGVDVAWLQASYQHMVRIRQLDKKAVALQRTGQMHTYPPCLGQEAIGTGIGLAMQDDDILVPYYRDQATQVLRGVTMQQVLQVWGGDERGNLFTGVAARDFPNSVPIGTQMSHAAGIAAAMKSRGVRQAVVANCGDGATSRGDVYEALNLVGVWQLPMVAVVNNNQWAISVPRSLQTGTRTLAEKALAVGIEGLQVDGNDVVAVFHAVRTALARARRGKGGTLIEAVSYRLSDHTTADDATRYRDAAEVSRAWDYDPVKRLQTWLHASGHWTPAQEQALLATVKKEVDEAVSAYLNEPPQAPDDFIAYVFAEMTPPLLAQRDRLLIRLARDAAAQGGDSHGQ
ncbi:MAG: pyruvate dehydrogenase (acetyl-transferring) E1 component subunit alpha [Gammaproteobacteria bacterium]|nr:pyruvate dehydrogenase (acetyl-transferring) E1 component subunit alpha [Gammaproteobacteria bacterium]|tara:strand:+ start:3690 stop:4796 length:1107 start_codon:yes stop_codon:yes gene_type:complete